MSAAAAIDLSIPGYTIKRLLGQGGMATVYLATQEKLRREVALKVILPQHAKDDDFRSRFISEGQLTARLFHRHVMTVFDIGEANGCFYMSTEVLSGGTLAERLPSLHSVIDKLLILREVAEGLGYAHSNSVIHRDIKPGNILFRADGTAVVADFGIAKALDITRAQTLAGMIVGTPSYMSPEQVQGQPLDGRSDIYSLGIVLYQMLTGELPYNDNDVFAMAMAHIARPMPRLPPHLMPLQSLLDSMVEKLPLRRIESAAALCQRIDELLPTLDDAALSKGQIGARQPAARGTQRSTHAGRVLASRAATQRKRWLVASAGLLMLMLMVGGWLFRNGDSPATTATVALPTAGMSADEAWLALAEQVRERIAQRRYFTPSGGSAHDALTLMLSERPTDIDALELIDALCQAVASDVLRLIDAGNRTQAGLLLSQAQAKFANHPALMAAAARHRGDAEPTDAPTAASADVDLPTLRRNAREALAAKRISSPAGDNAVAYLREILRKAPADADAQEQLRRIAGDYAASAQHWLDQGNPGQANAAALRGLEALPGDVNLLRLQAEARAAPSP